MKKNSEFQVVEVSNDFVFLIDLNGPRSVTNDAENVVNHINNIYPNRRIVYRDSMNNWDELQHNNGEFTGFAAYKGVIPSV